jgi:hypothetical protein
MSGLEGHEPPHVPHWMQFIKRELPGVASSISSKNSIFVMVVNENLLRSL